MGQLAFYYVEDRLYYLTKSADDPGNPNDVIDENNLFDAAQSSMTKASWDEFVVKTWGKEARKDIIYKKVMDKIESLTNYNR